MAGLLGAAYYLSTLRALFSYSAVGKQFHKDFAYKPPSTVRVSGESLSILISKRRHATLHTSSEWMALSPAVWLHRGYNSSVLRSRIS
jgi:hypothetical protein